MSKCRSCEKGNMIKVDNITLEIDGYIFILKGERCNICNEEFIDEDEIKKLNIKKLKGSYKK